MKHGGTFQGTYQGGSGGAGGVILLAVGGALLLIAWLWSEAEKASAARAAAHAREAEALARAAEAGGGGYGVGALIAAAAVGIAAAAVIGVVGYLAVQNRRLRATVGDGHGVRYVPVEQMGHRAVTGAEPAQELTASAGRAVTIDGRVVSRERAR